MMYFVSTIVSRFLRDVKSNRNRSLDAARYRSPPRPAPGDHISGARRCAALAGRVPSVVLRVVNLARL